MRADDDGGLSFERELTIGVTNVNEAPLAGDQIVEDAGHTLGEVAAQRDTWVLDWFARQP